MFGLVPFNNRKKDTALTPFNDIFDTNRFFETFFNDSFFPSFYANSGQMKVDITENDQAYTLEAELPGVSKDDIKIEIERDRLIIGVRQEEQTEQQDKNYIRKERRSSSIIRSFPLENIADDQITAKFENGLLTLNLPKKDTVQPSGRQIPIN